MTTENKINGQTINNELITALYCRLSVEDIKDDKGNKKSKEDESNSIANQKQILLDYCKKHNYTNTMFFVDDGISGTSFERTDFQRMQRMAEEGKICRIIVKDLSRFGREQVEAGRLTQIVFSITWYHVYLHTGECEQYHGRRYGNASVLQYIQRMVRSTDFQENPYGMAVKSG